MSIPSDKPAPTFSLKGRGALPWVLFTLTAIALVTTLIVSNVIIRDLSSTNQSLDQMLTALTKPVPPPADTDNDPSSQTKSVNPSPIVEIVDVDVNGKTIADLQAYLTSPERAARYEAVQKAGRLVAEALNNGLFGEPERRNGMKVKLETGYTGEGSVAPLSNQVSTPLHIRTDPFAWVWWNSDGTIGEKPITQFGIMFSEESANDTYVNIAAPNEYEPYWRSLRVIDGELFTNQGAYDIEDFGGWGSDVYGNKFTPTTLAEYQQLDDEILAQLDANMVSWFGPDWQNK